jgi:hypothetical protein
MKSLLRTYSHPVLGNGDDFKSKFVVAGDISVSEDKSSWIIAPEIQLENASIQDLIDKGYVAYHMEVECPATFFRIGFDTFKITDQFSVSASRLRGKVKVDTFIVALKEIPEYSPLEVHEDYGSRTYHVSVGEIIGVGGSWTFVADTEFDPLKASANSFIKIERGDERKGNFQSIHGPAEIIIRLPQDDYDLLQEMAGEQSVEDILHATIVFPVLLEAVKFAQNRRSNDGNDRLRAILEQRNLMDDEPLNVAQIILQAPVSRALSKLRAIKENE